MNSFVKGLDLHTRCSTTVAITESSYENSRASRAVTFVATETLKNVVKPQGSHLCKHWWTYPTCAPVLQMDYLSTLLCSINIQSYYSFILFYIFSSFMKWQFPSSCSTSTSSSKLLTWKLTRQTSMATIYKYWHGFYRQASLKSSLAVPKLYLWQSWQTTFSHKL